MNRTILTATAGLMLASLAVSGAHADGTKNFTVRAGGFFPTDGDAKRALGNTWFSFGGDLVIKNTQAGAITSAATLNSLEPLVYVDYASKDKTTDGFKVEGRTLGVGVGARYFAPSEVIKVVRPYIAAGAGLYFVHGKSTTTVDDGIPDPPVESANAVTTTSTSKSKTNFGFKVNGGVEFAQNYVFDVGYWNAGKVEGVSLNGYTVSLGLRF